MLIAGEASGDLLAAELVFALRAKVSASESEPTNDVQPLRTELASKFFGAGGPRMAAAGVELAFDLTKHSVIGISEVLKKYLEFRRLFNQLLKLAIERQPDAIIGVDYGGFNLRFGHAIRQHIRAHRNQFNNWNPKIVQFVSPQVWASRPKRAYQIAEDYDLLLSIFPFEKDWYARRVPKLRVEFVGHPMVGRFQKADSGQRTAETLAALKQILLLPGSRADEVRRHLPMLLDTLQLIQEKLPAVTAKIILPNNDALASSVAWEFIRRLGIRVRLSGPLTFASAQGFARKYNPGLELQAGNLSEALANADLAITKSGTITMECAMFGVPAVVFYKTSWPTYVIGRQIVTVKYLAMPNLLADAPIYPEFIQHAATPKKISQAALEILRDPARRQSVETRLAEIVKSLGGPGAAARAADAIVSLLK